MWEEPSLGALPPGALSSFSRPDLLRQAWAAGLSDPVLFHEGLSAESWIDDTRTVLQGRGFGRRAALFRPRRGRGRMAMLYAANVFRRTPPPWFCSTAFARRPFVDADYPWGVPRSAFLPRFLRAVRCRAGGNGRHLSTIAPSVAQDPRFSGSGTAAIPAPLDGTYAGIQMDIAISSDSERGAANLTDHPVCRRWRYNTARTNAYIRADGRSLSWPSTSRGAKFVEVPGMDHLFHVGENRRHSGFD